MLVWRHVLMSERFCCMILVPCHCLTLVLRSCSRQVLCSFVTWARLCWVSLHSNCSMSMLLCCLTFVQHRYRTSMLPCVLTLVQRSYRDLVALVGLLWRYRMISAWHCCIAWVPRRCKIALEPCCTASKLHHCMM